MWFYGYRFGYGGRFGGGSKKKKKQPKDNWFERLNQSQIKELLGAARLPVSGTKKAQIERLFASPITSEYGEEAGHGYMSRHDGKTVDDLKADCKAAGLVQGGVKYDLVMRLIKHKAAAAAPTPAPAQPKAAALGKRKAESPASKAEGKRVCVGAPRAAAAQAEAKFGGRDDDEEDEEDEDFEEDDDDDEDNYEVDRILSSRKAKGGKTEYLVRWKGYDDEEDNTWEPAAHLHKDLILEFEANTAIPEVAD